MPDAQSKALFALVFLLLEPKQRSGPKVVHPSEACRRHDHPEVREQSHTPDTFWYIPKPKLSTVRVKAQVASPQTPGPEPQARNPNPSTPGPNP